MPETSLTRAGICCIAVALAPLCLAQTQPAETSTTALPPATLTLTPNDDQQSAPVIHPVDDRWRAEVYLWTWLMGIDGDVGVRGRTADVSASIIDIVEASDSLVALSGRLEIGHGRLGAFVDVFYADLGVDDTTGPVGLADIDITYEQTVVDFGLMYRVGEWNTNDAELERPRSTTLDLYAGGRYSNVELTFSPANIADISGRREWVDPIVGAKLVLPFSDSWRLLTNADIGGFGVESDLTWSATMVLGYDFHLFNLPASVMLGYRAIGWDYSEGSGDREFTWDVVQHGPMLGLSFRF